MRMNHHDHQSAATLFMDAVPLLDDEFDLDAATYPQEITEHMEPEDSEM